MPLEENKQKKKGKKKNPNPLPFHKKGHQNSHQSTQ
jgi:hypothetical protein